MFPSSLKRKATVFKFLRSQSFFEKFRFRDGLVWTGRSISRNKAAFSNFSDVTWTGHQLKKGLFNFSVIIWQRRTTQCEHHEIGTHNIHFSSELMAKQTLVTTKHFDNKIASCGQILSIPFCSVYKGLYFYFPTVFSFRVILTPLLGRRSLRSEGEANSDQ